MQFTVREDIAIDHLCTFHYFELAKDFVFSGEKHDFWEFAYVDKGELEVTADADGYVLRQGDLMFWRPNVFHSIRANRLIGPNVIVVTFRSASEAMRHFGNQIFRLADPERRILSLLVREALQTFEPPLDDPYYNVLTRKAHAPFASEQLVKMYLQQLLIQLVRMIRGNSGAPAAARLSSASQERTEHDIVQRVTAYLENHVERNISLQHVADYTNLSKNYVNRCFANRTGASIMQHYRALRIEHAKLLIREGKYNISEIAAKLHYSNPNNFSRRFRLATGMYPTDYAKSVMCRAESGQPGQPESLG